MRAPPVRRPSLSKTASAPPRWAASWVRTRPGGKTAPQHTHVAFARVTVPVCTSSFAFGSNTSNSTRGGIPSGCSTRYCSARLRVAFLHSQNERMSGISAPQFGDSQRTVRAQRYAMGVAPSGSVGYRSTRSFLACCLISAPTRRRSSASVGPWRGMSSSITFRIRQATGLRSLANASHPSRSASSGIEPPPANGSTTSGGSSPYAAFTRARLTSRYVRCAA